MPIGFNSNDSFHPRGKFFGNGGVWTGNGSTNVFLLSSGNSEKNKSFCFSWNFETKFASSTLVFS